MLIISTRNLLTWSFVLMWVPAFASIIARLVLREGVADVSFRFGGRRGLKDIMLALVFPIIVGLVAYGIAWITGLTRFAVSKGSLNAPPLISFIVLLLILMTIGTVQSALTAAGEEIGWRGYMLTRLIDARIPRPVFVSGLIWALWHLPLIFSGLYAAGPFPALSAGIFMVTTISLGYVIARLRLESGSIWPAIFLHAAWNAVIQAGFDHVTKGSAALLWTGESGILVALTIVVAALIISRGQWTIIHVLPKRGGLLIQKALHS
jgi:membrane protease YdiL (CAAX protease family)